MAAGPRISQFDLTNPRAPSLGKLQITLVAGPRNHKNDFNSMSYWHLVCSAELAVPWNAAWYQMAPKIPGTLWREFLARPYGEHVCEPMPLARKRVLLPAGNAHES